MNANRQALGGLFLILMLNQGSSGEDSAPGIKRYQSGEMLSFANFRKYPFHSLLDDIIKSMYTEGFSDCAHICLETKGCVSFNIRAEPDATGRYHCEKLGTDLFYSPHKFQGNGSFHHYTIENQCTKSNTCKNGGKCFPDYQNNSYHCQCRKPYIGRNCDKRTLNNCMEYNKAGSKTSGVYKINPDDLGPFDVYCDQNTKDGGWTVFQKRLDGSVDFFLGWADYKQGFGNLSGEFWLGLDKIHRLTSQTSNKLRVELEDFDGNTAYAEYDLFTVSSEASNYKLSLGTYSGTAGDSLSFHHGMSFTTKDRDNDNFNENCALLHKGGWWYNTCHSSNLNALYHHGQYSSSYADGVTWYNWKGHQYSAKRAEMKIRPVGF